MQFRSRHLVYSLLIGSLLACGRLATSSGGALSPTKNTTEQVAATLQPTITPTPSTEPTKSVASASSSSPPTATPFLFQALPPGEYIVFSAEDGLNPAGLPVNSLYVVSLDNGFLGKLVNQITSLALSPDHRQIAYAEYIGNPGEGYSVIGVFELTRNTPYKSPRRFDRGIDVAWPSAQDQLIVQHGSYDIYLVSIATGALTLLVSDPDKETTSDGFTDLTSSPNGRWLAFYRRFKSEPESLDGLYVTDMTCTSYGATCWSMTRRLFKPSIPGPLAWADENKLAILDDYTIRVFDVASGDQVLALETPQSAFSYRPDSMAWSPDGKWLAIHQVTLDQDTSLFLMSTDQEEPVPIYTPVRPVSVEFWLSIP